VLTTHSLQYISSTTGYTEGPIVYIDHSLIYPFFRPRVNSLGVKFQAKERLVLSRGVFILDFEIKDHNKDESQGGKEVMKKS